MKKIILILIVVIFSSCSGDRFFSDFDEVEYYALKNDSLMDYENKKDSLALKIFNEDFPMELNNKDFYKVLNQEKFSKFIVNGNDILTIGEIFKKRFSLVGTSYACIPNFRDILVLKRNKSIIGIAKICIECEKFHFVGNNDKIETSSFGENNEFEELNKVFKKLKQQ